jgi:hypothetical protein
MQRKGKKEESQADEEKAEPEKSNKVNKVSTMTHGGSNKVKPQGLKSSEANDKHGCVHHGFVGLNSITRDILRPICVDGYGKIHARPINNEKEVIQLMYADLSTLLLSKEKQMWVLL